MPNADTETPRVCLTCGRHGPPVSARADHGPCARCVTETGAPDWVPVTEYAGDTHDEEFS